MFTSPQLAGISDFNFILAQNHMPATLWCQPQIARVLLLGESRRQHQCGNARRHTHGNQKTHRRPL